MTKGLTIRREIGPNGKPFIKTVENADGVVKAVTIVVALAVLLILALSNNLHFLTPVGGWFAVPGFLKWLFRRG
jgi:hypothetical protein